MTTTNIRIYESQSTFTILISFDARVTHEGYYYHFHYKHRYHSHQQQQQHPYFIGDKEAQGS